MATAVTGQQFKSVEIRAQKILADGTTVDLGVVGYWHRNPLMRAIFWIRRKLWPQS